MAKFIDFTKPPDWLIPYGDLAYIDEAEALEWERQAEPDDEGERRARDQAIALIDALLGRIEDERGGKGHRRSCKLWAACFLHHEVGGFRRHEVAARLGVSPKFAGDAAIKGRRVVARLIQAGAIDDLIGNQF